MQSTLTALIEAASLYLVSSWSESLDSTMINVDVTAPATSGTEPS